MGRTGRRPGEPGTRAAILAAARRAFAQAGYDGASVRGIAGEAGVDPALVHHYFGNKHGLFVAAMEFPVDPRTVLPALLAPGVDGLGERLVRLFLSLWESNDRSPFLALIRGAVSHEESAALLREFVTREVLGRVAAAVDQPQPELARATLVGSQMVGLAMARYVIRLEPLASADVETVVAAIAPTVQRYLTEPLTTMANR